MMTLTGASDLRLQPKVLVSVPRSCCCVSVRNLSCSKEQVVVTQLQTECAPTHAGSLALSHGA
jgi:hypothetical protein